MTPEELSFVDDCRALFSERYGLPPMFGQVMGFLLICDPPEQTAAGIAEGLGVSRGSVSTATRGLVGLGMIHRGRRPGDRRDRFSFSGREWEEQLRRTDEIRAVRRLTRRGLEALADATPERRRRLLELAEFYRWWEDVGQPLLLESWQRHRASLESEEDR